MHWARQTRRISGRPLVTLLPPKAHGSHRDSQFFFEHVCRDQHIRIAELTPRPEHHHPPRRLELGRDHVLHLESLAQTSPRCARPAVRHGALLPQAQARAVLRRFAVRCGPPALPLLCAARVLKLSGRGGCFRVAGFYENTFRISSRPSHSHKPQATRSSPTAPRRLR